MKDRIYFLSFDADGVWAETDEEFIIRYGQITTVRWENRYVERWRQYLEGELTVGNYVSEKLIFQFRESRTQVTKNCQLMRENG